MSPLSLSQTERKIFNCLSQRIGQVKTYGEIRDDTWGLGFTISKRTISVHISSIRKKLKREGFPVVICTLHGRGFYLEETLERKRGDT